MMWFDMKADVMFFVMNLHNVLLTCEQTLIILSQVLEIYRFEILQMVV